MASGRILWTYRVCFRHISVQRVLQNDKVNAVTEVSLILLQAEEKQRNGTSGSVVPSSSRSSSANPPVASAHERRPANKGQALLQRPQAGLQVPHVQAQPQVQS